MTQIPAIVMARGGSRRLPRKNLLKIAGRSLVEWSIIQLCNSHLVSGVWMTTDDDEIAEISFQAGAEIIREKRDESLDRPHGGNAMFRAVNILHEEWGLKFDAFLGVLPTCITWKPDDFDKAIQLFWKLKAGELAPKYVPRECYVSKILGNNLMRRTTFGKSFQYAVNGEQWLVATVDWFRRFVRDMPKTDSELDRAIETGTCPQWLRQFHYYPIEWWQQFDIDDSNDFSWQENLMEHFILKALGRDCYERYGMTKDKDKIGGNL